MAVGLELDLEEILSQYNIAREDLDEECSPGIRYEIAVQIIDWKMIGYYFGIPKEKLVAIEEENRTAEQRRVDLLCTWSMREGRQATYLKLIKALYHRDRRDLVETVCKLIRQNSIIIGMWEQSLGLS